MWLVGSKGHHTLDMQFWGEGSTFFDNCNGAKWSVVCKYIWLVCDCHWTASRSDHCSKIYCKTFWAWACIHTLHTFIQYKTTSIWPLYGWNGGMEQFFHIYIYICSTAQNVYFLRKDRIQNPIGWKFTDEPRCANFGTTTVQISPNTVPKWLKIQLSFFLCS